MRSLRMLHRARKSKRRRGLATAELAVCLPVIALVVFASIEACSLIFLQESIQTTAYETARFAVAPNSTSAAALARGNQVLSDRVVKSGTIELDPADVETTDRGEVVRAVVRAPLAANRSFPSFFYGDQNLTATVTMLRE